MMGGAMGVVHKIAYSLLAAVPVVALAACSSGGGSNSTSVMAATGPAPEVRTIIVDAVPTADEGGLYVAEDNGYFKQQGLTVKIVPILGGEYGMGDLQTGKAQIIAGNYVSFILAQIAGKYEAPGSAKTLPINMRIIADGSQMQQGNQALYVMPGSRFKTVADLAKYHSTVAINSIKNVGQVLLGSLFKDNGLDLDDIHQVVEAFPDAIALLAKGKIDAAWLPEPFGTIAQESVGAVPLADFDQGSLQSFPIGAYVGTSAWVQSHPNTVAAFLRALAEGQQVADTDRAAVEEGLENKQNTGAFAVTPLQAATMTIDTYPLTMDIPVMQRVSDAMFEFDLEPGLSQPYQIINMVQSEPGMVR
jgi:NitT/TauT family transport system substrate-binding protein